MNLSARLKDLRKNKKLTQEEVSKDLNINRATYAHYETGRREPDLKTLMHIAEYYNVSIDNLLGATSKNRPIENFNTPEEAMKFILSNSTIMGFGGFDVNKLSDDELMEFANEMLNQLKLLGYKYKK